MVNNNTSNDMKSLIEALDYAFAVANTQYSEQWTKFGNLQTSAGAVMTLVSVVSAVATGSFVVGKEGKVGFDFQNFIDIGIYTAIALTILYMFLTCIFMYQVLKSKSFMSKLRKPMVESDNVVRIFLQQEADESEQIVKVLRYLTKKIDFDIKQMENRLLKNRTFYNLGLKTAMLCFFDGVLSFLLSHPLDDGEVAGLLMAIFTMISYLSIFTIFIVSSSLKIDFTEE